MVTREETDQWGSALRELFWDPHRWYDEYKTTMKTATFELGPDEYLMLGDNSPRSRDSRLWSNTRQAKHRYAVERSALVGKAFFIYWPHGEPFLNGGHGYTPPLSYFYHYERENGKGNRTVRTNYPELRVPFYPQVMRMHRIR